MVFAVEYADSIRCVLRVVEEVEGREGGGSDSHQAGCIGDGAEIEGMTHGQAEIRTI
jgi:hypothetical protein